MWILEAKKVCGVLGNTYQSIQKLRLIFRRSTGTNYLQRRLKSQKNRNKLWYDPIPIFFLRNTEWYLLLIGNVMQLHAHEMGVQTFEFLPILIISFQHSRLWDFKVMLRSDAYYDFYRL